MGSVTSPLSLQPATLSAQAASADQAVAAAARALGEQQIRMLTRLAEFGLELAAETVRRTQGEPLPADAGEGNFAMVYSRVARAVRMTLALQSRVMKELLALNEGASAAASPAEPNPLRARRERVNTIVQRVIETEHSHDETIDRLSSDAWERLTDDDIYGDITDRPLGEVVARICEDLGLSPDWTTLAREAWAVDEAATGAPGSPFPRFEHSP
jgi:hypothetical protein